MVLRSLLVVSLAIGVAGCSSNTGPDDGNGGVTNNGCFAIVGNHGTMSATITGLSNFTGTIPNGSNVRIPTSIPAGAIFVIQATNVSDGTSVLVGGPVKTGLTASSLTDPDGQTVQVLVTTRSCTALTGIWSANLATGASSVNLTSASASGVSGSFNGTLTPSAGSGAVGNKTVSGTFNVTF